MLNMQDAMSHVRVLDMEHVQYNYLFSDSSCFRF